MSMGFKNFQDTFIRWAGGKTWFLPVWRELIDGLEFNNYYEPFLGGGSIFFSLTGSHECHLSDLNSELITTYQMVRENPAGLYKVFKSFKNEKDAYYRIRSMHCHIPLRIAARFLYLNQTSYNGLYRVNKKGEYNVPFGYRTCLSYDKQRLLDASQALNSQEVHLFVSDFEEAVASVGEHDLVFFDPPYTVANEGENGFIEYNEKIFSLEDQRRLGKVIDLVKQRNAYYVLTNAAHEEIAKIFTKPGDRRLDRQRLSAIGGTDAYRGRISEYVFTNIPERKEV